MIVYYKASSIEELKEILELQKENLSQILSQEEKTKEGFVTVEHSLEILKEMNEAYPHSLAKYNDKIIGYALSMTKEFGNKIEVLKPMFKEVSKIVLDGKYLVMGQICIDKKYRKQGVFKGLYNFMKTNAFSDNYDLIITEIDIHNSRSLKAHESVGFHKLKDYSSKDKYWRIVSLKI
jgi:L-amino acid N-acyltransferase YncA